MARIEKAAYKPRRTFYETCVKRFLDVTLSLFALIVLSPLFLLIMILSKLFIHGRVFFYQYRPGKDGKVFKMYKFRSMTDKTDDQGNLLPDAQRITKFGRFLRKLSLDELPQLVNILRGDMSIVGPRPRVVSDIVFYNEQQLKIYSVRPGLTSLGHVSGSRSTASWDSVFEKDLQYVQKITFWRDLKIVLKTFIVIFQSDGAAGGASDSKREYFYKDYLLKNGTISQEQYDLGISLANEIIGQHGAVTYNDKLQHHGS